MTTSLLARKTRWLLAAAVLGGSLGAAAQGVTVLPNPTTVSNFSRFPFSTGNGYVRSAFIYRAADIRAAGGTISQLEFIQYNANTPGAVPLKVYLKSTSATQFTAPTTVAAEETGATLVYNATLPASSFTPAAANNTSTYTTVIPLSTTFAYNTCDNLEVIIETNATGTGNETANGQRGGTVDGKSTIYAADGGGGRITSINWFADNAAPTGTQQINSVNIRPVMRVTGLTPTAAPDAGVLQVLTQNKVATVGGPTQVVKAFVRNYGTVLAGTPVTLTVTGPGGFTYTNTQTVSLTASAVTTVTFTGYTPPTTAGTGTVSVSVAASGDTYACNNTLTEAQEFSATTASYVTPGVFSPGGRGFGAATYPNSYAFAAKFTTSTARNFVAVRSRFSNDAASVGQTVYGVVANASTGALIARSADYVIQASDLDGQTDHTFTLTAPVTLAAGTYVAGMAQTYPNASAASYFPQGTQPEYQGRGATFYTFSPTAPTTPTDIGTATTVNYKFPVELVTDVAPACGAVTSVAAGSITSTGATITFSAPGGATDYTVTYTPTAGGASTTVSPNPSASPVPLTGLTANTQYTVTVTSNCPGGATSSAASTTFTTLPSTDAAVLAVYTLGELPIPYGAPHAVSAAVRNNGATATTVPATLTVTGPGGFSFTDTQTSASLAAAATGTVTFAGYTPTATGTYTVTVTTTLTGDQVASNDAQSQTQTVNTTTFSYTPVAAAPASSVGFNTGSGLLVAKFATTASRQVTAVTANLSSSAVGNTVYGVLLSSTGALLGRSNNVVPTAAGLTTFTLQTPVVLPAGAFYAGLAQTANTTTGYFPLSTLTETPTRAGAFYTAALAGGTPADVAANNLGRFIIEAVTTDPPACGQATALTYSNITDTSLSVGFTPPTGTTGVTYTVTLTPTSGAPVSQTVPASPAPFTGLTPGTSYAVSVVTNCAGGATSAATTGTTSTLGNLIVSTPQTVSGSYYNVTVTGTGTITSLTANLNVSGTMLVQSGGTLVTSAVYYVLGTGTFALQAGATIQENNTGGISNATATSAFNFASASALSFSPDANYIFSASAAQVTGVLMPAGARNLTVNNSAGVTLTSNLTVAQVVRLTSGNLVLNGKSLLLPSTTAGTALVVNTNGVVSGATASMQRLLTNTAVSGPAYRHLSSPVTSIAFDSLRTGGFSPVFNPAYNSSATPAQVRPFPTVFAYDEGRITTVASSYDAFNRGWFSPASGSSTMAVGRGYTVNAPIGATPYRFTGTLNTGSQSSGTLSWGTDPAGGWQLLGNPYPSPLDWSSVTTSQRPGVDGSMYVFQSSGQYAGTYRSYVNAQGASPIIEAGAAYFVRLQLPVSSGSVNLTNTNRVTTYGNPQLVGRGQADQRPQLQLQLRGATLADDLYLYLQNGATAGVDPEFDARKLTNPSGLNLSTVAGSELLAIDGRPLLTASTVVPLHVGVPAAGTYTLEAAALLNFTSAVYLYDAATNTTIDLSQQPSYSFSTTATTVVGRFSLQLRPAATLAAAPSLALAGVSVYPNPAHDVFTVLLPAVAGAGTVQAELFNSLGQVVRRQSAALPASGASLTVPTADLAVGVYTLRLQAGTSSLVKKVVIQ